MGKNNNESNLFPWLKFGTSIFGNVANVLGTILTNKSNERIAAEQNAMQQAESEKAYQRSKATTQVQNLQDAGMSKAGALSTLNGGGSYTPAPITSSTAQAPQIDLTTAFDGLMTASENYKQRKSAEDLQAKQIKAAEDAQRNQIESQERQQKAQLESNERIAQLNADTTNRNADKRLDFDREQFEYNKPKILAEIEHIKKDTKRLEKVTEGQNLQNIRAKMENENYPELAKAANAKAWQDIQYLAQRMAHENADAMNKQERESLELEFYRATMDAQINLTNLHAELQSYLSVSELGLYNSPVGDFIGALAFCMDRLVPKFALFK